MTRRPMPKRKRAWRKPHENWGESARHGWTAVPNLLLDYLDDLAETVGISPKADRLLIRTLRWGWNTDERVLLTTDRVERLMATLRTNAAGLEAALAELRDAGFIDFLRLGQLSGTCAYEVDLRPAVRLLNRFHEQRGGPLKSDKSQASSLRGSLESPASQESPALASASLQSTHRNGQEEDIAITGRSPRAVLISAPQSHAKRRNEVSTESASRERASGA